MHTRDMNQQPSIVMGEVTDLGAGPQPLACDTPGVSARRSIRKGRGFTVEERLYECANGLALAARRGGPLHLADAHTWEVAVLTEQRYLNGKPVGWVDEAKLQRLVARLAEWFECAEATA